MSTRSIGHRQLKSAALVLLAVSALAVACTAAPAANTPVPATPAAQPPAALDGKALVKERCVGCHDLAKVEQARKSQADWASTVQRMIDKGSRLNEEEQAAVVEYLAVTFPQ